MGDRDVTITISAKDNFSSVMNKYKEAVKGSRDETKKMETANKTTARSFTDMKDVVQGVFGAAVLQQFGQAVGHLNEIGMGANKTDKVFNSLTKTIGGYETILAQLRQTTGGVVSDTLLMESSNKLLLSGLAANGQELNKIIEISTKLGGAMGNDAASSLEQFSLMLLNQSIPRLDSFGISASKVREEINRLIETGQAANREEAFKMATFAEASVAMDKLGDSLNVGETAFDKIGTKIRNATDDLGQFVAGALEAGAQILLLPDLINEANKQELDFYSLLLNAMREEANLPKIESGEAFSSMPFDSGSKITPVEPPSYLAGLHNVKLMRQRQFSPYGNFDTGTPDNYIGDGLHPAAVERTRVRGMVGQFEGRANVGTQVHNAGKGNLGLMTPEAITSSISVAEDLEIMFKNIEDTELVSDVELSMLESMRDSAVDMADEAERAKQAFENMSLSSMFGQGSGGRLGELGDMILSNIGDEDQRAVAEEALNKASGRETDLSQAFEDKFSPLIADVFDQFGEEIGIQATEAALNALEQGQLAGKTPEEIIAMVQAAIGYGYSGGGSGTSFDVKPGDTPWGISQQTGLSYEEIYGVAGGGGNQFIYPGSYNVGGGELVSTNTPPPMDEMQDSMDALQESKEIFNETPILPDTSIFMGQIESIDEYLVTLSNTPVEVEVTLKVDDSELVAVGWSSVRGTGGTSVRRNGGSVQGEDPRTPQKPWD